MFVQGWEIRLNFPQVTMFYRLKKICDCSGKMYLFGNGYVLLLFLPINSLIAGANQGVNIPFPI